MQGSFCGAGWVAHLLQKELINVSSYFQYFYPDFSINLSKAN
jgi:hypothetical protein